MNGHKHINKRSAGQIVLFFLSIFCLVLLDQWTKRMAMRTLAGRNSSLKLIPGILDLRYVENRGMAFGLLEGASVFFLLVGIFVFVALTAAFLRLEPNRGFLLTEAGLVLVCAGAVGNMIDRFQRGYVIDFLSLVPISFPVFNIADCCVVIGAILLAFRIILSET